MYSVSIFEVSERIRKVVELKGDEWMLYCFFSVNNDLIVVEVKYYKDCFFFYVSKINLKY